MYGLKYRLNIVARTDLIEQIRKTVQRYIVYLICARIYKRNFQSFPKYFQSALIMSELKNQDVQKVFQNENLRARIVSQSAQLNRCSTTESSKGQSFVFRGRKKGKKCIFPPLFLELWRTYTTFAAQNLLKQKRYEEAIMGTAIGSYRLCSLQHGQHDGPQATESGVGVGNPLG